MRFRCMLLALCAAWAVLGPAPAGAWSMYYYRDEAGVYHFTNRPNNGQPWNVFAVFREFPGVGRDKVLAAVRESCWRNRMDPRLIEAVIQVESNFQPGAVSHAGAQGIMQIMPETQKLLGLSSPFDYRLNIEAGVRYLRMQYDRFQRWDLALAAYNAGPEAVAKYRGVPPYNETQNYVRKVLAAFRQIAGYKQ
jgi:hypothetical protein